MASRASSPKREEGRYTFFLWCILWFFLGVLPSLALVVSAVRVFFPGSLFAKVVAGENFQVANRNVTREPQWFVRQAALERARHPPPPSAAAWPRPGSQPCPQLHRGGRGGGGTRPAGRGASHAPPREFPRVRGVRRPLRVLFVCGVCKFGGRGELPSSQSQSPAPGSQRQISVEITKTLCHFGRCLGANL